MPRRPSRRSAHGVRPLMLAVHMAAAGTALAVPLWTPEARAQVPAEQARRYAIPAGPLTAALNRFAEESGVLLSAPGDLTQGKAGPGLSGEFTVAQGFAGLLAGSGLVAVRTGDNRYTLQQVSADGAMTLDPVTVEGSAAAHTSPYEAVRTEGSKSYTTKVTTVGKGATAIKDIPQSVSVVTRQMMDDRNVTDLTEAMKQTTGMTVVKYDGAGLRNNIQSRGYVIDTVQLDGVAATWDVNYDGAGFDAALYDRIEVLRGPSGLYQSGGEPGGTINLARKRALDQWTFGGEAGIGSWNAYRGVADVTGPLVESKKIRARIVGVLDDRESFVDVVESEKKTFYGTVEADLTDATTLSVGAISQKADAVQNYGLTGYSDGRLLDVDRSTFIGADWNHMDYDSAEQFAELRHRLDNGGMIQLSGRHMERDVREVGVWADGAVDPATGNFDAIAYDERRSSTGWSVDGHVDTPLRVGGLTHNLLLGADYRTEKNETSGGSAAIPTMNLYSLDSNIAYPTFTFWTPSESTTEQYGTYGQARIKPGIEWLTLVAGSRLSWWNTESKNATTGATTSRYSARGELTPYGGVVFDASKQVSFYASYTEIFKPQSNLDPSGKILNPRVGGAWEVGAKGSFLDDRLNTHLSAYHMVDENRAMAIDGCTGSLCYEAAGKVRSRGVEAQVGGSPWPNWDVTAGYAYVLTDHLEGTVANKGNTFSPSTPKHTTTLWAKYTFPEGSPLYGFNVGGGMKTVSSYYFQNSAGTRWVQDGYTTFDARVGYAVTENLGAALSVTNLFDEKYYEKVSSAGRQSYYGAPRGAMLTLRATF